ncbi:MAG TPA: hypothetical protein VMB34_11160 [Acetobacteraceae bacterium]|nr:hypothetical protein [Acetobacteraceae bacterium]
MVKFDPYLGILAGGVYFVTRRPIVSRGRCSERTAEAVSQLLTCEFRSCTSLNNCWTGAAGYATNAGAGQRDVTPPMVSLEREATIEEIVAALRAIRPGAENALSHISPGSGAGVDPTSGRRSATNGGALAYQSGVADRDGDGATAAVDIARLRDREIDRLLAENAKLNQRVMFLLKVIERTRMQPESAIASAASGQAQSEVYHAVRIAVEAEVRPVLLAVLRLLQKQRDLIGPPGSPGGEAQSEPASTTRNGAGARDQANERPATDAAPSDWLVGLLGRLEGEGEARTCETPVATDGSASQHSGMRRVIGSMLGMMNG